MKPGRLFWVLGAVLAAGGCATAPSAPNPILFGRAQPLAVRTDPPGAACTLAQRGEVVGTVEVTTGVAQVPRDFKSSFFEDIRTAEGKPPLEIACVKDGYLEFRRQFQAQFVGKVWQEEVALQQRPEPTPTETAKDAAAAVGGGRRRGPRRRRAGGAQRTTGDGARGERRGGPGADRGHRGRRHHRHPGPAAD